MSECPYEIERYNAAVTSTGFSFKVNNQSGEWCKISDVKSLVDAHRSDVRDAWVEMYQVAIDGREAIVRESAKRIAQLQLWLGIVSVSLICALIAMIV